MTGAEYKTGKARTIQLDNYIEDGFSRFIKLDKIGRGKYSLIEIYKSPIEVQNYKAAGNSSIYFKYIELIILKYLSKNYGNNEVIFNRRKLWLLLGMINNKYHRISDHDLLKIGQNLITQDDINSFYLRCNSKLNTILETALKNLSRRKLINFEERTIICMRSGSEIKHVVAESMEREILLAIEYDVLKEFKCGNTSEILLRKLGTPYYKRIKEIIKEEYDWEFYYKAYSIVFKHDNIKESIPRLEQSLDEAIHNLNEKIVSALNKEANTIYQRDSKKRDDIMEDALFDPGIMYKLNFLTVTNDNYLIAQQILADELVNISKDKIVIDNLDIFELNECCDTDFSEDESLLFSRKSFSP